MEKQNTNWRETFQELLNEFSEKVKKFSLRIFAQLDKVDRFMLMEIVINQRETLKKLEVLEEKINNRRQPVDKNVVVGKNVVATPEGVRKKRTSKPKEENN